ncbi:MAG: hypothetical protein ACRD15_08005, partial [Vicinamibacterales bacterium]
VEGWVAIGYLWSRGEPLQHLRDLNVDAIARGVGGLRIDDLPRAFWYTPQHAMSYALGLVALPVGIVAGSLATWPAIALAGLALGASVTLNPLVGALFCIVYALLVVVDAGARQAPFRNVLRHAVAAIPVLLALGWTTFNKVAEGAGAVLHIGLFGPAANAPVVSFLLSFGPILILVLIGVWPQRTVAFRQVFAAAAGVALSVLVMHLLTMTVDLFWVGFRTGHLFLVFAPALVARGLVRLAASGAKAVVAASALVFVLGMPTTAIDAFNAQDVDNDHMGPGFHWTVTITAAEQEALAWIRQQTPVDAIVQADPIVRGRETWSLIPTWGERRMAGGQPISLMHVPAYDTTSTQIRQIYATGDVLEAWRIARQLHIDFLYVGAAERHAYPQAAKFERRPDLFAPAFDNAEVTIYAVARDPVEAHR